MVGARPQFVKLAPVAEAFHKAGVEHMIIHTGQHYDPDMSDVFFADLKIPHPDISLAVGSGSHGAQTGAMLAALELSLLQNPTDWVLVYGDTNSTLAAALAAVKLHIPVAHLEAGLRSFNRRMPEEHNRVLTDHASDLLLAPTAVAVTNLEHEGLGPRTELVGDVMTDVCFAVLDAVRDRPPLESDLPQAEFILATLHRPYNTDVPERLREIIAGLAAMPVPVLLTAHPRLVSKAREFGIDLDFGSLRTVPPLAYPEMIYAIERSSAVVTDSGGLQKEAYLLGTVCTTIRSETEWSETLLNDWNLLVFDDLVNLSSVATRSTPMSERPAYYGDGNCAASVVETLLARADTTDPL